MGVSKSNNDIAKCSSLNVDKESYNVAGGVPLWLLLCISSILLCDVFCELGDILKSSQLRLSVLPMMPFDEGIGIELEEWFSKLE